jgi:hypothetical protein
MPGIKKSRINPGSFQPNWLPASVINSWFDPTFGVTLVAGNVSSWVDRVNSHAMVQATALKRPVFNATGGGQAGNLPYLQGDGISKSLQGAWALTQPNEQFFVLAGNFIFSGVAGDTMFDGATGNKGRMYIGTTTQGHILSNGATDLLGSFPGGFVPWQTYNALFNGASSNLLVGQQVDGLGFMPGDAGANNAGGMTLFTFGDGVSNPSNVQVSEIVITTGATASQQNQIVQYLAAKGHCK